MDEFQTDYNVLARLHEFQKKKKNIKIYVKRTQLKRNFILKVNNPLDAIKN